MRVRNKTDYIKLFFKGALMGIADAMPGISGGTIALLVGIYEELIESIGGLNFSLFNEIKKNGFRTFWKKLNGNFFLVLASGIGLSLISFVKVSATLLYSYPLFVWSFFLGLIFATIHVIFKLIQKWKNLNFIFLILSIIFSIFITVFTGYNSNEISLIYILFSGIIASSAMILPGVSGSLILVMLGVYAFLVNSLNNLEINIIITFAAGAIIGLVTFSNVLKYLFKNHRDITYTLMLGLVIGSIEKAWPWNKEFAMEISNFDLFISVILVFIGFLIVFVLEKFKKSNGK
tara:strand:+ start:4841 stop:5710 length:870 start_codon:yes stop_codon:yes gene_type:complete